MTYFLELIRIAWRSVTQRAVPSLLTILSMALGVCLVVMVLTIVGVVENSFRTTANLGYNMVVGAKGGQEQLTLNSVFYLSKPVENVSYDFFMEFHKRGRRDEELTNSYRETARHLREVTAKSAAAIDPWSATAAEAIDVDLAALDALDRRVACDLDRDGRYGQFCSYAIPLCMGDYVEQFRVVGTTPEFFELLDLSFEGAGRKFSFAQGRAFVTESPENSFFEAVVGSAAAKQLNIKLGDKLNPSHGAPDGHKHQRPFVVVGILSPTGSANDRAVFINMEGFYLMEDHAKPTEEEPVVVVASGDAPPASAKPKRERGPSRLPVEEREITAMLVRNANPIFAAGMMNGINEGKDGMAVAPVGVISNLFDVFVGPIKSVLLLLAVAICFVSGISILVSIYNSMNERRHEIAVMRALGAGRGTVMSVILFEAVILALAGGLVGWLAGHVGAWSASGMVEERTGVQIGFYHADPTLIDLVRSIAPTLAGEPSGWRAWFWTLPAETVLLPMLVLIATLVGVWPAISAYQTDVVKSLGK